MTIIPELQNCDNPGPWGSQPNSKWIFERYEKVRDRLPKVPRRGECVGYDNLIQLADHFDVLLFDSFGVLNVGETAIDGATRQIETLRDMGKRLFVLTNAATTPIDKLPEKYNKLGFSFSQQEIISSREVLAKNLSTYSPEMRWSILLPGDCNNDEFLATSITNEDPAWKDADGFILMSSKTADENIFEGLCEALVAKPRPVLVGNPDLAAPRQEGFSFEPGYFAHRLADQTGINPIFYGKPFGNAYQTVFDRMEAPVEGQRMAMIGDTLHTDVLGGLAAGISTVLVTNHGVLKSMDILHCIETSNIVPDFIIPTI